MRRTISIAVTLTLLLPVAMAMPPPWSYYPEACEDSGGNWPGSIEMNNTEWQKGNYSTQSCICPENTTLLWGKCWKKTPKETCKEIGGKIASSPILGPPGVSFKCVEQENHSQDITSKAENYSVLANQEIKKTPGSNKKDSNKEDSGGYQWILIYALLGLGALLAGTVTGKYLRKRKER